MLGLALRLFDEHPEAAEIVRSRFHAFTVDEFQDVNPLQAGLLDRWLGPRDDLCVVGDDYQTIYAFTGASPDHLLGFTRAVPARDGRPSRGELPLHAGGPRPREPPRARISAGSGRPCGRPRPRGRRRWRAPHADEDGEVAAVVEAVRRLHDEEAVPLEEIAVLYRINARSEPFEEAFAAAGIPYQVRDGAFLRRPGPRGGPAAAEAVAPRRLARGRRGRRRSPTSSGTTPRRRPTPTRR